VIDMYTIKKLVKAEVVDKPPEDILRKRRRTGYDKVLQDAKDKTIKLVLKDEKRAENVCMALRQKAKARKMQANISVGRIAKEVYVFPSKLLRKK